MHARRAGLAILLGAPWLVACGGAPASPPSSAPPPTIVAWPSPTARPAPVTKKPVLAAEIVPGVGFADMPLGHVDADALTKRFGQPTRRLEHNGYSIELDFDNGLSAFYCEDDARARIIDLTYEPPFEGLAPHGIRLVESRLREVVDAYGMGSWESADGSSTWTLAYPSGIAFLVQRDTSLPQYPLDEARHLDLPIVAIEARLEDGDMLYQCGSPWPTADEGP